jgi:hypothetical protein
MNPLDPKNIDIKAMGINEATIIKYETHLSLSIGGELLKYLFKAYLYLGLPSDLTFLIRLTIAVMAFSRLLRPPSSPPLRLLAEVVSSHVL